MAERSYKEIIPKLATENEVVCNDDFVVAPEIYWKQMIKNIKDNIDWGRASTH